MLKRMYLKWAQNKKYKSVIISEHKGDEAGIKSTILQIHGDSIRGEDNFIDRTEINLVKVALANSATNNDVNGISHDSKSGYGLLNANEWANQVDIEFN